MSEVVSHKIRSGLEREFKSQKDNAVQSAVSVAVTQLRSEHDRQMNAEKSKLSIELADLQAQLIERSAEVESARKQELELRKQQRELKEASEKQELEIVRRLDGERVTLIKNAEQTVRSEYELQLKQREKLIEDLRRSVSEVKRKSEVGSQEAQGEALELAIEEQLRRAFPIDRIDEVKKGASGADLVQSVVNSQNQECGIIVWEAKNAKRWQKAWVDKLKDDQRNTGAALAVLVSQTLPEGIERFGQVDGVWVSDMHSFIGLATALREHLVAVKFAINASAGKTEKVAQIYEYLSAGEFKHRIEAIVDSFNYMQDQLWKERRAMEKLWREREKNILRITENTVSMYGEMQGIIGGTLPTIPALELDNLDEDS
ncbi:MAG: DUF2130 domain-containing protein [Pseudomonadota bacterium]